MVMFSFLICAVVTVVVSVCLVTDYLVKLMKGNVTYYNLNTSVITCSILSALAGYTVLEWLFYEALSGRTIQM